MAVRAGCCCSTYFYPRPPRGGRLQRARQRPARFFISIHALREEGDLLDRWEEYSLETFLSTPSARRATVLRRGGVLGARISIHALREEGDSFTTRRSAWSTNFYPRPPRGGRRGQRRPQRPPGKFLSTPSARRATIKFGRAAGHFKISIHALREEGDRRASAWPRS